MRFSTTPLPRRTALGLAALTLAGLAAVLSAPRVAAQAAASPPPTVRLLVGYTAGGPVDSAARLFAPAPAARWPAR